MVTTWGPLKPEGEILNSLSSFCMIVDCLLNRFNTSKGKLFSQMLEFSATT